MTQSLWPSPAALEEYSEACGVEGASSSLPLPNVAQLNHMPTVEYIAEDFAGAFAPVNGANNLDVSWPFLVWSAISVGRAGLLHLVQYGEYSLLEMVYRAAILFANLRDDGYGQIRRSEAYLGLDPSEKSAISYFLGLTMAKAFAETVLAVPWLIHLDVYRDELLAILEGQSHPDLVGQTAGGDWIVVEAKGRSNSFDQTALEGAKEQAQAVVTIGGTEPVLRIGMVTHFSGTDNGQLRFRASDPPPDERRVHRDLPLSRERLIEGYYRPFRMWLSRSQRRVELGGRIFRIAEADNADFTVGVAENRLEQGAAGLSEPEHHIENENYYIGRDGVLVILGSM